MGNRKLHETANSSSRRDFIKSACGAGAVGLFAINVAESVASDLPKLDESDSTAAAFKYVHDAASVDESVRPQKDRFCYNCALYEGNKDDEWAGCGIFPGKSVAGKGWCTVWAPKQGT